ncbi:Phosphoesterase-domain-containing protein [Pleurostoma richardsiae]|uniref:Phosphoesterase-domain-containing protein n=1 Tax=Pleurostoma richardsiae TaxID=41990 RepID=A0AA38RLX9_9PEZI|nr:Phosphoesterase-domain-containing protein [Pleurostoma richardsiae]
MALILSLAVGICSLAGKAAAGSLADIDHVVLFMQENRAFDHYFGTLYGVRGFSDPNVQLNNGTPVWQQKADASLGTNATSLNPWYVNYLGGDWLNATQCMEAGDNGWSSNHEALNFGLNDAWATNNTPWSWSHFRRSDLPVQFAIADTWTIGDMYQESVIASTNPNRVTWVSGSINVPGSPQNSSEGGYPYIDNNEMPGCDDLGINCYPLSWKTVADIYQDAGVTWQVYQDADNFDDNPFAWFKQFQDASTSTELYERGFAGLSLETFYAQAGNGTLPAISYIIGPSELSEHQPYAPRDGAWLQKKIVDAVTSSPAYNSTVLIISYDETGGYGDHVTPYHSPQGTAGEWIQDPYADSGYTFAGPGFRLPFYIISPWTRGGAVFTEHADHNSQIMFVEEWQKAKGVDVTTDQMVPWRREHMSNLVSAFDFENPDYSVPELPYAIPPHTSSDGAYNGAAYCEATYPDQRPPVPYEGEDGATTDVSSLSEEGFRSVRGYLTEGRWLTFEQGALALTNSVSSHGCAQLKSSVATQGHESVGQRWVVHAVEIGGSQFRISSAVNNTWLTDRPSLTNLGSRAGVFDLSYVPGSGHAIRTSGGAFLGLDATGAVVVQDKASYWDAFSVTYHS